MGVAGVLSIIFMSVILPLVIILHYTTKWKQTRGLGAEEQQMLEELWESTERMESRLNALETILDDRATDWRDEV